MGDEKQTAVQDPLIGQVFGGRYSVRTLIGRGGVGLVYLAENTETGEDVVLKILSPDWSRKPEAVRRFKRESERLGGVRHPNIVRLLDSGQDSGRAYLVMEYLEGEVLSDFIAERRSLDLHTFVPIAAQVLKGVGHAHSRGVMLRDIKPANIMLCERKGRANFVKILDFGLAKLTRDEQPVTEEHVLGTAGYLAPEVIEGNEELDVRVDVFSLGALFYFMLSGRLPFEGDESATVFYKTIHNDPVPLHDVLPTDHSVPEGLIKLVHQCLVKAPTSRPDDANAIVEQLIDVVPASLFRLPKVERREAPPNVGPRHPTGEVPRPGYGNTGLVQLVGSQAISGRHPTVAADSASTLPASPSMDDPDASDGIPTPILSPDNSPTPEPVTLSQPSQDPQYTGPVEVQAPQNRGTVLGLAAAVVVLAGGLVYFALQSNSGESGSDSEGPREASVASAGAAALSHDETLSQARTLIDDGELVRASDMLDSVRAPARTAPALAQRVKKLDSQLAIAKLMAAGEAFEADGETASAVQAYRDVLKADATHVGAAAKLKSLAPDEPASAAPQPATIDPDAVYGPVNISSRPLANLFIDGEPQGTTPFKGSLSVGTHTVRMTARGYLPWQEELNVLETGTENLRARLVGKGRKRGASDSQPPVSSADPKEATPSAKPAAAPEPAPKPTPKAKKPSSVFLPTKDSQEGGGGVFLPTKD
ncbi:MAG: serine/threonine protein kinase [Nannocystales bacterium]